MEVDDTAVRLRSTVVVVLCWYIMLSGQNTDQGEAVKPAPGTASRHRALLRSLDLYKHPAGCACVATLWCDAANRSLEVWESTLTFCYQPLLLR